MKSIVVYFSLTGNTEKIASAICSGVKQAAGHCDIKPVKETDWRRLYEYDIIGLGCPVMGFVEPPNIRVFIRNMRFVGGKHVFVFSTHGTHPEFFFPSIVPKLNNRGLTVIGTYDCYAPSYQSAMPVPYPTAGHPDEIDLKEAEEFGRAMAERSQKIYAGETGLIPPPPEPPGITLAEFEEDVARKERKQGIPSMKPEFKSILKFRKDSCNYPECRLCTDNCPMDGIDLSVKPPVIAKPCMNCLFCAKICPTGAIYEDPGMVEMLADRAVKMFPAVYLPPLEKAESEGRFRRLVPLDKIGYDTPLYKLHNKHPQWVIGEGLQ